MAGTAGGIRAGKAFVEIGGDDKPLRATLAAVSARMRAFGVGLAKVGLAAGAAAVAAAGGAIAAAVTSFVSAGSAVNDMAARTGMAVEEVQKLAFAAKLSGASIDDVETASKKAAKAITAAAGGSVAATKALADLGLSASQLIGLSPDQQFDAIARALGAIEDPTQRAAAAMAIFGKSGTRLLPMIQDLDALKTKATEVGGVMSAQDVAAADALGDAFDTMTAAISGVANAIGAALAPVLTGMLDNLTAAIATVSGWIQAHYGYIVTLANMAVDAVVAAWNFVKPAIMPVVEFLGGAVVDAFIEVVTEITNWRTTMSAAFVVVELAAVRTFNQIVYFLTEVVPGYLSWFADNWASVFVTIYDYTTTVITNLYSNLQEFFVQIVNWLAGDGFNFEWKGLTEGFESSIRELPKIAEREIGAIEGQLQGELDALSGQLVDSADKIRSKLQSKAEAVQAERNFSPLSAAPAVFPQFEGIQQALTTAAAKFSGLSLRGSADAFKIINQSGRDSEDKKQTKLLEKIADNTDADTETVVDF